MSLALRALFRNALALSLGATLLTGCIVVPVGHRGHHQRQEGYNEPVYPPAPGYGGNQYGSQYAEVRYATVSAIEPLGGGRGGSSGAGAITGSLIGGVIGHEIGRGAGGRHSGGGAVGAVIGAVGGAVIGDQIERDAHRGGPAGYRVWLRLDGGGDQSVQVQSPNGLWVGARVRLVNGQLQPLG